LKFVVIDGLDGSGKDTQARMLKEYLAYRGERVVMRAHPSPDNWFGATAKKALTRGGKAQRMIATLFYGLDVIRSTRLYCGGDRTVIFVRYTMACAYLPRPLIRPVYRLVSALLPRPDDKFFLDVSPEEALRRVRRRGEQEEMFETLPHMQKVRERAMLIASDWKVIDGNVPPDAVFQSILAGLNGSGDGRR
jgi:dTMP kinase